MKPDEALHAARSLLPWWATWGSTVALPLVVFLISWIGGGIISLVMSRQLVREPDAHWTVKAVRLQAWLSALGAAIVVVGMLGVVVAFFLPHPLAPTPDGVRAVLAITASVTALALRLRPIRIRFGGPASRRRDARAAGWRSALMAPAPILVALLLGCLLPQHPSPWVLVLAITATVYAAVFPLGLALRWARRRGVVRSASLLQRDLLPDPGRIHVFDVREANAIAFPLQGEIAVTQPALELFDRDELGAVLRHELGHLREPKAQSYLRLFPTWFLLALGWWRPISAAWGTWAVLALYASFLIVNTICRRVARRAEVHADHHAHGGDSPAYARALEKLSRWNLAGVVASKRATHPGLHERMVAAGVTPDWSAPPERKPSRWRSSVIFAATVALILGIHTYGRPGSSKDRDAALRRLALGGNDAWALFDLAGFANRTGDDETALVFYRAAEATDPRAPFAGIESARLLARLGRCAEAHAELDEALSRFDWHKQPEEWTARMHATIEAVQRCR